MRRAPIGAEVVPARECVLPEPIAVHWYPSPLRLGVYERLEFRDDLTVEEILELIGARPGAPWDLRVRIAGARIPPAMWPHTRPNPGTFVTVHAVPHGGQTGKGVTQVILGIALLAFAFTPLLPLNVIAGLNILTGISVSGSTAIALGLGGAALIAAGSYSLAAPPPVVPFGGEIPTSESRAIAAAGNEARPFAPVPRMFGRYRVFPQYAAKPYTEVVGNDQFLRLLFTFGYGPLSISEIRIGEDLVDNFEEVEYVVLPGYDDDPDLSIYTSGVDETVLQVNLEALSPATTRTTEPDAHESSLDLSFPAGLVAFEEDDGRPQRATAHFTIEYRAAGSGDPWVGITATTPLGPGVSNPTPGEVSIDARARGPITRGVHWRYPSSGQWEIRITRGATTHNADNLGDLVDECFWTKLRSIRPGTAPRVPNLAMLEMRIRATDQLSGAIRELSAMCESILPVWNALDGWGPANRASSNASLQATRNPAWALAEMLRGRVNPRPVPDENIDHVSLAEWAVANTNAGRNFDAVVDYETTIGEVCRNIAASARAAFNVIDGRYGVVYDGPKPVVVAQFSARDVSGFAGYKAFPNPVHALRVRFVSPEGGYEPDERIVYADGYDESTATEFGELDLWGVTDPDRAYLDGRYHLAAGKLRPEVYSFDLDVAQLAVTRGDRVLFSHDVMLVGLGAGRISELVESGGTLYGFRLDAEIDFDPALAYVVRVRFSSDGHSELYPIENLALVTDAVILQTPLTNPAEFPEVGDLVAWGEAGRETGDYLVHSVRPTSDLGARIELVDYSPEIFDVDSEPIPAFDPNISIPRPRQLIPPDAPTIEGVVSDESVLAIDPDGTSRARIVVAVSIRQSEAPRPDYVEAQYRTSSPVGEWYAGPRVAASTGQLILDNVEQGETYDVRVRASTGLGIASPWATVLGHLVIGSSTPPPDVLNLRVEPGSVLAWDYPAPPRDFAGFRVRHQAGTDTLWQTAIPAHDGLVTESRFVIAALPPGTRTLLVKAVDTSGNESESPGVVVSSIGGLAIENIVESRDFHALGFPGTITDATVEPGTGDLIADFEVDRFWPENPGQFWGPPAEPFWGDAYKPLVYEDSWTPTAAAIPGRLVLEFTIQGSSWRLFYREQGSTAWLRWPGYIDAEASTTYEFRLEINGGQTRGRVEAFAAVIDKPDVEELIDDFAVAASGTVYLPVSTAFAVVKQVLVTIQDDGNGGVAAVVGDKTTPSQIPIVVYDETRTRVAGLIDARVRGYI